MRRPAPLALSFLLAFAAMASLSAYTPPAGGLYLPLLGSPSAEVPGLTVTALDSPWADRLNPAASATQQRPVLAAGFEGLTDFGGQGFGAAVALGLSLPKPYGVWGGGLRLVSVPTTMTSLPLGTLVVSSVSLAKSLYPNFQVGASADISLGGSGGFGWGAVLNLGFIHYLGDKGSFKDLRWGGVLSGLGKGYTSPSPASGGLDGTATSAWPPVFTPTFGIETLLVRNDTWKLGAGATLGFPSFQDLDFYLHAKLSFKSLITLSTSWGFDLRSLIAGTGSSLVPSLVLSGTIPIQRKADDSIISKNGWDKSEVAPSISYRPLSDSVAALGVGLVLPLGVVDRKAPRIAVTFPASEWGPYYLSPNADGSHDLLSLPTTITDERYLQSYTLLVYKGSLDKPESAVEPALRTIANKESRPENEGFSGLWARLVYVQKGLASPETLSWDGRAGDGSIAPDGSYTLFVQAFDDNGNPGLAGPYTVVVDSTPPESTLAPAETSTIFSPDGDGNKDSISFKLTGSVEDLWTLKVLDSGGMTQRSWTFAKAAPSNVTWDGKSDSGAIVPDGVYSLVLQSTDRAGNSQSRRLDNILVNTQQPPINVAIDLPAFSPNGDGRKDSLTISSSVPVRTGLVAWKLSILDKDKVSRWSLGGSDPAALPTRQVYEGKTSQGQVLPEGQYQAELEVTYSNGHHPKVLSPVFTVDLTPPSGTVKADRTAFNPAGSEGQNIVNLSQTGSREESWTGELFVAGAAPGQVAGQAVRTWTSSGTPETKIEWDGADDQGKPLPDGSYVYRISSTDKAGNLFQSAPVQISLDTQKKGVRLSADPRAFSPNGDGQKDALRLTDSVLAKDKLTSYVLEILGAEAPGTVVRTWKGTTGLAETYTWDGLASGAATTGPKAADGRYLARLRVSYQNGDVAETQTPVFVLDTQAPTIKASASPLLFSPNGDGRLDSVAISQDSSTEEAWTGSIVDSAGQLVRSYAWKGQAQDLSWDGTDEAGNPVKDGAYRYLVQATDAAGNKASAELPGITVDNRPTQVFLTASETGISPNGDAFKDSLYFSPIVNLREGISSWRLSIANKAGAEIRAFTGASEVPARIDWDGKDAKGQVQEGEFVASLTVDYAKGDKPMAKTGSMVVDVTGPAVRLSTAPALFSPDNDGIDDELRFGISVADSSDIVDWRLDINETSVVEGGAKAKERLFISWGGKGVPAPSIAWDGRSAKGELVEAATDYPWVFVIKDALGNVTRLTGAVSVDVLVIRDGDRLKIKVPSIVFRANFPDFVGLDQETLDRNAKVIKRIAQILNRFKDYRIQIEGHANSEGKIGGYSAAKIAEEETKELIPLSQGRAELVRKLLAENGVDPARLSTMGLGSSEPVVDFKDAENRWKNRRVEFVLIRNK